MTTGSRRAIFAGAARIAAGAATATGLITLASCGGDSGGGSGPIKLKQAVSLQYWSILGGADGTRMHDMTSQYTKEQPMVKIEDVQGVDNFLVKFVASVVAGSPPDIVWIRQTYIAGFVEKDALLPLLPKELDQVGLKAEEFDQVVWKASEYKGKRYTVPMDIHGYQFFYHEAMVRDGGLDPSKVPTTWAEWLDWATRLTKDDKRGATVPYSGAGINWFFHGFLKQAAKANVGGASTADFFT
ncbi:MAG: extracellular solute-binding protein, partial [Chloroflexi bacterium]|nr:extracellular solute-binding protein [Chloroflexota bacterium]